MTILVETPQAALTGHGGEILHYYCEDCGSPDWSLCGLDISANEEIDDIDGLDECVVCVDLDDLGCPHGAVAA